jgi:hypothetical protein
MCFQHTDFISFEYILSSGILDHMVTLFVIFKELSYCFLKWLYYFTFLHSYQGFTRVPFSMTLTKLIFPLFNHQCNMCKAVSHCDLF